MQTMTEIAVTRDNSQAWTLRRIRTDFIFGQFRRCPIHLLKKVQCVHLAPRRLQEDNGDVRVEKDPLHWMTAVTPARCMTEQNVEMLRAPDGKIDFRSTREIEEREELRVWCNPSLGQELGIYEARVEDKEGSQWVCPQCGDQFLFPNLLSAHVTFVCDGSDVIKETTNGVELETERQRDVTEGEISETTEERHGKSFEEQDKIGDARRRQLSDNWVGPSEVRYVARPSAREFSFYSAYGLSLAQQNQRLLNNPKIARLISSFSRPRLLTLSNEPESLAEHQKKEFRKKFQGNEHYLRRHLYRDGESKDAGDLETLEGVLNGVDEDENAKAEEQHNKDARHKTAARDSSAKYGPFYSSDDFRLVMRRQAGPLNEASDGSSKLLRSINPIFDTSHGVCRSKFQGSDGSDAACTCGSHGNPAFLGNSEKEVTEAIGIGKEMLDFSRRKSVIVREGKRNGSPGSNHLSPTGSLSISAAGPDKNSVGRHCLSSKLLFHENRYLRLDAFLTTPLPYKLPTNDGYCSVSRFSLQHPEPTLYMDPLYHYSPIPRMLAGTLSQSPAQKQPRAQGFRCDYCGKAYCRKYVLKIHMRTHTGFKPLQCKVCDKTFSDPSNMKKHVKLHETEDTVHQCPHCGRNFVRYRGLLNHLKSKHS